MRCDLNSSGIDLHSKVIFDSLSYEAYIPIMPEASPSPSAAESLATLPTAEPQGSFAGVDRKSGLLAQPKKEKKWLKCPICNEEFVQRRKWQEYCSKKCKNKNFWRTHKVVKTDSQPLPVPEQTKPQPKTKKANITICLTKIHQQSKCAPAQPAHLRTFPS